MRSISRGKSADVFEALALELSEYCSSSIRNSKRGLTVSRLVPLACVFFADTSKAGK